MISKLQSCIICAQPYEDCHLPGLVRCRSCGFISANLQLPANEVKRLYSEQYFRGEEYRDYVADRPVFKKHFQRRLKKLLTFVSDPASKHLLEIGCAYGFFLAEASKVFATVHGIDIASEAIQYAREQLHEQVTDIEFLDYTPDQKIDVVCMWDTIEHLETPAAYIKKVSGLLAPGGVLAITTGDIESRVAKLRGARWRQIHPPTHLHYFSKRTLTALLEANGFQVRYAGSDGQYRSMTTMAHGILMVRHNYRKVFEVLRRTRLLNFSVYLNLYDIMYVVAEKIV